MSKGKKAWKQAPVHVFEVDFFAMSNLSQIVLEHVCFLLC